MNLISFECFQLSGEAVQRTRIGGSVYHRDGEEREHDDDGEAAIAAVA